MVNTRKAVHPICVAILLCLGFGQAGFAVDSGPSSAGDASVLSVSHANDLFVGSDRHYTAGSEIRWLSAKNSNSLGLDGFTRSLPFVPEGADIRTGLAVRQLIFTPNNISVVVPPVSARLYAGLLQAELHLTAETDKTLDQWALRVGVTGDASGARVAQEFIHDLINSPDPLGWDTQVPTEPVLSLSASRIWRMPLAQLNDSVVVDWLPRVGGIVGNSFLNGEAGAVFRIGNDLGQHFGYATTGQALGAHTAFSALDGGWGWSLFAGGAVRLQGQNIALDGGIFRDSLTVDRNALQGDFIGGIMISRGAVQATFLHITRTEEFVGQKGVDSFWTLQLSVRL